LIYLLDTNILIYLIKNRPPQVAERIDQLTDVDSLAMSFITWAELLCGAEGSQRREATLQQLDALARQVPVLYPDGPEICRHYALQASALKRQATPIGGKDLWIACHALSLGATLVSHNVREFVRIDSCCRLEIGHEPSGPQAPGRTPGRVGSRCPCTATRSTGCSLPRPQPTGCC
jgi:tRNA(fMet)-specific endonuclease VapC